MGLISTLNNLVFHTTPFCAIFVKITYYIYKFIYLKEILAVLMLKHADGVCAFSAYDLCCCCFILIWCAWSYEIRYSIKVWARRRLYFQLYPHTAPMTCPEFVENPLSRFQPFDVPSVSTCILGY